MKTLYLVCNWHNENDISLFIDNIKPFKYSTSTRYTACGWEILIDKDKDAIDSFLFDLGFNIEKIPEDFYEGGSLLELQVSIPGEKSKPVSTKAFTQFVDNPLMSLV